MDQRSYVTNLLNGGLGCAQRASICTLFDNPLYVEERANALSKIAYEKGEEIYRNVGANEKCFGRRTATPDRGHLGIDKAICSRRVSQALSIRG